MAGVTIKKKRNFRYSADDLCADADQEDRDRRRSQGWDPWSYSESDYDNNPIPNEFTRQGPGVFTGPVKVKG